MRVGLKFMLEGGHFLAVFVEEAFARDVLRGFKEVPPGDKFSDLVTGGVMWVVDVDSIVAIHTFQPEQTIQQAQQQFQPAGPVWSPPPKFPYQSN